VLSRSVFYANEGGRQACQRRKNETPEVNPAGRSNGGGRPDREGEDECLPAPPPLNSGLRGVFEDEQPRCRVRNRHVVTAVYLRNFVVQNAAHRQPKDKLRALRTRLEHQFGN